MCLVMPMCEGGQLNACVQQTERVWNVSPFLLGVCNHLHFAHKVIGQLGLCGEGETSLFQLAGRTEEA
jgi:hypothetical protein